MKIKARYYDNIGNRICFEGNTVEDVILSYRGRRKSGANFGEYSIDGGNTWLKL